MSNKKRDAEYQEAYDRTRLVKVGSVGLIQEPHPAIVALRQEITSPAHVALMRDLAKEAVPTFTGALEVIAAYCGYQLYGIATTEDVYVLCNKLTEALKRKAQRGEAPLLPSKGS